MANQKHLDILKQGVETWNQWQQEHPEIRPDLSFANLSRANLLGADLRLADLVRAHLWEANLSAANLSRANLLGANLSGANLSAASLFGAVLSHTNLSRASLTQCCIYGISAWKVQLAGAIQDNLVITPDDEPIITVDNLELA